MIRSLLGFCIAAFVFLPSSTRAQEPLAKAVVKTEGAMVFDQASFDGQVVQYLPVGKKIVISKRPIGDVTYGMFYRFKMDNGRIGYITTIDVGLEKGDVTTDSGSAQNRPKQKQSTPPATRTVKSERELEKEEEEKSRTFIEKRWIGASLEYLNYSDTVAGSQHSESDLFFGAKATGPGLPYPIPSEINLLFYFGAPSYYSPYSSSSPSGYILISDFLILFPFVNADRVLVNLAGGPMLAYSSFSVTSQGLSETLVQLSIGLSAALQLRFQLSKRVAANFEYKFMWEAHQQSALGGGLQFRF